MAGRKKSTSKNKTALQLTTSLFYVLAFILSLIGKPFYFILSHIFIAVVFIFYIIGHYLILFTKKFFKLLQSIKSIRLPLLKTTALSKNDSRKFLKSFKISFPVFHLPKFKINLPKISFPKTSLPHLSILNLNPFKKFSFKLRIRNRFLFPLLFLFLFSLSVWYFIVRDLPSPYELTTRQQNVSTRIYDRNGVLLYTIYKDQNRSLINLSQIPQHVRLATLAAEDAEFYQHSGISVRGIIRAISKDIRDGKLQGGSTITQQLVKNALLTPEKTFIRKLREVVLSFQVEASFEKDQILEMYLNEVGYGGAVYGISQASRVYFGKDVGSLTLAEAAMLAGLPQSPSKFSPFGAHPELSFSRQREVLHLMKVNKFISSEEEASALSQRITFAPNKTEILAPHFVMYAKEKLIDMYGEGVVQKGGLEVATTLDINIQKLAEKAVSEEIARLRPLNVGNAAVVVLNPKNGEILAMVGSKDYFDTANDGNVNVTTRLRQPGSSIKLINYAYALSNGLTLSSTIDDTPITFKVAGGAAYSPKNYDGKYRGKITVRSALAESRNIPAVKILASYGVDKMIGLAQKMGITTWLDRSRFGLSLTLGGGEVRLLDLAQVYSVVANLGVKNNLITIKEVKNYKNKVIYTDNRFNKSFEKVLDSRVAYLLIDVLKDNIARSPAFGSSSMLVVPNHPEVAVKTGTSNELRDNLTVGFNQNYLVAVWVGNNDNTPMSRIASGITGAAPIWNKIMRGLLANTTSTAWPIPERLVRRDCFGKDEWYLEEKVVTCPKIVEPAAAVGTPSIP